MTEIWIRISVCAFVVALAAAVIFHGGRRNHRQDTDITDRADAPTTAQPACWCTYGREGREFSHPGCPTHDPENTLLDLPAGEPIDECETCCDGWEDCGACDGSGEDTEGYGDGCSSCGARGEIIPPHCCVCGGSPYCQCCSKCGSSNAGRCSCLITVQRADGGTKELT